MMKIKNANERNQNLKLSKLLVWDNKYFLREIIRFLNEATSSNTLYKSFQILQKTKIMSLRGITQA